MEYLDRAGFFFGGSSSGSAGAVVVVVLPPRSVARRDGLKVGRKKAVLRAVNVDSVRMGRTHNNCSNSHCRVVVDGIIFICMLMCMRVCCAWREEMEAV